MRIEYWISRTSHLRRYLHKHHVQDVVTAVWKSLQPKIGWRGRSNDDLGDILQEELRRLRDEQ